jgi:hypothetical protein
LVLVQSFKEKLMKSVSAMLQLALIYGKSLIHPHKQVRKNHRRNFFLSYLKDFVPDINRNLNRLSVLKLQRSIDVVMPILERDIEVAKHSLKQLEHFSINPIGGIYIIAASTKPMIQFCAENKYIFVDENEVCTVRREDLQYNVEGVDRTGWLFQQLLKLNWDMVSSNNYCLIFDADTIITGPQLFVKKRKMIFNCSDEYHLPYFEAYKNLLKQDSKLPMSFVSHYMVFERITTKRLKRKIESLHHCNWEKAIIKCLIKSNASGFSEYETYGHFMYNNHRRMILLNYWFNISLKRADLDNVHNLVSRYKNDFKTISFQSYNY